MEEGMEEAGEDGRDPRRGDLGQAKQQIPAPTDLFAEEDKRRDDQANEDVETAADRDGAKAWEADDPERGGDAEADGSDQYRSEDSDQQASSPSRMKPDYLSRWRRR